MCVFVCVLLPMFNIVQYGKQRSTSKWFLEHPWRAHTHQNISQQVCALIRSQKKDTQTHIQKQRAIFEIAMFWCGIHKRPILIHMHTYTQTRIHTFAHTHTHTHAHTLAHIRTYHIYIMIFYNTFTCVLHTHTYLCVCVLACPTHKSIPPTRSSSARNNTIPPVRGIHKQPYTRAAGSAAVGTARIPRAICVWRHAARAKAICCCALTGL